MPDGFNLCASYVFERGKMPNKKVISRCNADDWLRRCWSSRRPAAPFRGDTPRASRLGGLSSSSSRPNGRFGDAVALTNCGRGLCSCRMGRGLFCVDGGCSMAGMALLGRICTALEMMMGVDTGSNLSVEYRDTKILSLGSSGKSSAILSSSMAICESSPY